MPNPPTIAFVTHGSIASHATLKRATGLAEPLRALGIRPVIVLQESTANRERIAVECPGTDTLWFPASSALAERAAKQRLVHAVRPDVVWLCTPGLRNAVKASGDRAWTVADHSELLSAIPARPPLRRLSDAGIERLALGQCDAHVCASRFLLDFYVARTRAAGGWKPPLLYLPYAYSPHEATASPEVVDAVRQRYGDRRIVFYVGTFSENYGILDIVQAAHAVSSKHEDVTFVLAGRGRLVSETAALVKDLGLEQKVVLPGYLTDAELAAHMVVASVFVCPLRDTLQDWARCPSKLFLYAAHRRPIVTCRIGEAIDLFGDAGFFFEPTQVESMARAIHLALEWSGETGPDPAGHTWQARAVSVAEWLRRHHKAFAR